MNEFSAYIPGMWQVDGLLTVPKTTKPNNIRTQRPQTFTKGAVIACVFAMAIGTISLYISPYATQAWTLTSEVQVRAVYFPGVDVPPGYWNRLVTTLRTAPVLVDLPSDDLPPPLI